MGSFNDRVVVVTGGATGIGLASARRFALQGRPGEPLAVPHGGKAWQRSPGSGSRAAFVRTDSPIPPVAALAQQALAERGGIPRFTKRGPASLAARRLDELAVATLDRNVNGMYSGIAMPSSTSAPLGDHQQRSSWAP